MLAVLARSWALCWRSWAALGAYVGGLGLLLGPMLTVLGRFRGLSWRSWAKSGSNPSEDVIWQADQGREVAQTRAGRPFWAGDRNPCVFGARRLLSIFFCRYVVSRRGVRRHVRRIFSLLGLPIPGSPPFLIVYRREASKPRVLKGPSMKQYENGPDPTFIIML